VLKAQERRLLLARDGFSRGCCVRKRYTARLQAVSSGGLGQSPKAVVPPLTLRVSAIGFAPYLRPSVKETEPESGSPGEQVVRITH